MAILGKNIIIKLDGEAVAACKGCEIVVTSDIKEIANPNDGKNKTYIAGRIDYKFSTNHLVTDLPKLLLDMAGYIFDIEITCIGTPYRMYGEAICTQSRVTANVGSVASGSFSFQGTGKLTL